MKKLSIYISLVLLASPMLYAQSKSLHLSEAGTLKTQLTDKEQQETLEITITGNINNSDISLLAKMSREYALKKIDLAKAVWVKEKGEDNNPTQPSTTFANMPFPPLAFGATKAQVQQYEKENGGTYNKEYSNPEEGLHEMMWFDKSGNQQMAGIYFISKNGSGTMDEYWGFYDPLSLGLSKGNEGYAITKDFADLLQKSGFSAPVRAEGGDGFIAIHSEQNLELFIMPTNLAELTGESKIILVIQFAPKGSYTQQG